MIPLALLLFIHGFRSPDTRWLAEVLGRLPCHEDILNPLLSLFQNSPLDPAMYANPPALERRNLMRGFRALAYIGLPKACELIRVQRPDTLRSICVTASGMRPPVKRFWTTNTHFKTCYTRTENRRVGQFDIKLIIGVELAAVLGIKSWNWKCNAPRHGS